MTDKTRVYIAGSISDGDTLPAAARAERVEAFNTAEIALRAHEYEPINPMRTGVNNGKVWLDFMRASLRDIADCDGIALLEGWQGSRGARLEERLGRELGLPVHDLQWWLDENRE